MQTNQQINWLHGEVVVVELAATDVQPDASLDQRAPPESGSVSVLLESGFMV
jgi:hypothetical protein